VTALKLTACRPRLLKMLTEDDFDRRVEFSEWCLIRCEAEPDFPRRILWADEASFKLNGRINRHDSVCWSDFNPHEVIWEELNVRCLFGQAFGVAASWVLTFLWYCNCRIREQPIVRQY
jgi:hypothetical protein